MTGKYLKARQLAKEMEEKAKETAEKKEMAKEKKEEAKRLIEEARSIEVDLDLETIEEILEEGKDNISEKNFEEAIEDLGDVLDNLHDEVLSKHEDILEEIENFLDSGRGDEDFSSLRERIEESRELVKKGGFEEGFDKAFVIKKEAKSLIEERLNEKLEDLESVLDILEKSDEIKQEGEEIISKARYSLDAEEFERSFSLIEEAKETLDNKIQERLGDMIEKVEERMEQLENRGIEIPEAAESLEEGSMKKENKEYNSALNLIRKSKEKINQYYDEEVLQEKFENIDEEIEEAKEIEAPTGTVEEMKEEAKKLVKEDSIEKADELLKKAFEKIEEAKFDKVLNTIAESREDFIKAKDIGADIEEPMELLNTARDSLKDNDYKEALEWARKGREKVQDLIRKFDRAKEEIQEKRKDITRLNEVLETEFPELEELMNEAENRLEGKDYEKAISKLEELEKRIDDKVKDKVGDILNEFENLVDIAEDMEIEIKDLSKQLTESKKKAESGNYLEAANMVKSGQNIARKKIEEELEKKIEDVRSDRKEIKIGDEGTEEKIDALLDESEEELDLENYPGAIESMKEAKMELKNAKIGTAEQRVEKTANRLDEISKMGLEAIDLETYKNDLEKARDLLEEEKNEKSIEKVDEITENLNGEIEKVAEDLYEESETKWKEAKETGVKDDSLEAKLEKSKEYIEEEDFIEAIRYSIEIKEEAEEKRKKREEAHEKISKAASKLSELKKKKKKENLKEIREVLKEAKEEFKNRNYSDSVEKAEEAEILLSEFEAETLLSNTKSKVKDKLKKMKEMKISNDKIKEFNKEIEEICDLTEEGNYSDAQKKIEEKDQELNDLLEKKAEERIDDIREFLDSAQNIGFSVQNYKDKLKRTESLLNQDEILQGLDNINKIEVDLEELKDKSKASKEKIEDAKFALRKAEIIGSDIEEEKEMLEDARIDFEENRYEESVEKAKKAKVEIQNSQKERVEDIINSFTEEIENLRSKNVDTALAENKIQKAIKAKDKGAYTESIKYALQSEGELEKDENQRKIAEETLNKTEQILEEAQDRGILVDQARKSFQEVRDSYNSGFYPKVLESAVETSEDLVEVIQLYGETRSFLENMEGVEEEFKGETFDGSKLLEEKENIEENFQNGEYEKAQEHLENLKETLREHDDKIKELVYEVKEEIKEKGEKDVKEGIGKLEKAKALLDFKKPIKAMREIEQAKEISGLKKMKEYDELMNKVQKSIDNAKKFGAPVGEVKEKIEEAKEIKEKKDKIEAFEKMKEAHHQVEEALEPYSPEIEVHFSDTLSLEEWNRTSVELVNKGEALANDPLIEIRGGEKKDFDLKDKLKSGEKVTVEGRIKPEKENAKIIASALRIFDDKEYKDEVDLNVSMGIDVKRAQKKEVCDICGDEIEEGDKIISCSCGKIYEKSCGEEEEKCPNCGTNLKIELEEKGEKEKKKKRLSLDM